MKIIILSSCYPRPYNKNSGIFVHQQVKALQKLGVECHVIQPVNWFPAFGLHVLHPYWRKGYEDFQNTFSEYEGVPIHHPRVFLRMPSRFFNDHPWDLEGEAIAVYIKKNNLLRDADIVYAQFLIHEGYVGTVVKRRTGIPLVSIALGDDVHAWPFQNSKLIPFLKKALYLSDLVLANSKALADDTAKWGDELYPIIVQTIYQGIDLEKFAPLNKPNLKEGIRLKFGLNWSTSYLLCVATPVILKGWLNLLDSIRELDNKFTNWQLLIVAPKRISSRALDLVKEAETRGISRFVKYLGQIDHSELSDLMRAVDAFVLPSYNEGLSNAVIEAMATGLPVIATDVGGHREFIASDLNGILIPPNNTAQLIAAIEKIINNEQFRKKIASRARSGAEQIGSYEQNAANLLKVFKTLLKRNE